MGIGKDVIKGVGWLGALRVFTRIATLGKTAILARLLTPGDFGQFGIVALTLAFFETLTETGINQVVIQSDRSAEELADSAWIVAIVRGFVIAALIALAAYPLAAFFNNTAVVPLLLLIAIVPAVKGFINPMIIEFYKNLRFSQEFTFRGIIVLVDLATSITVAWFTRSALAFVIALLLTGLAEVILSFFWCSIRPRLRFNPAHLREILSFGKWMTLAGITHWAASELDDLVAGRMYGTALLGIYQGAYKVSSLPVTEIAGTINQASFPILSKVKDEPEKLWKVFLMSTALTTLIGLAVAVVLFVFPATVVAVLLGPQWDQAVPVIRLLALFGMFRTIESSMQPIFLAIGQPQVASFGNLMKVATLVLGLWLWADDGILGIARAALLSAFAVLPFYAVKLAGIARKT